MGLSNFPGSAEGVIQVLVMNTVFSVVLLKNMVRSVFFEVMGSIDDESPPNLEEEEQDPESCRERRISITHFKSLYKASINDDIHGGCSLMECCVCLCGFEADEEVSELSCKHFFHKACLDKWFDNKHFTCPLCRSVE